MHKLFPLLFLLCMTIGCASTPSTQGKTSYASYVGDDASTKVAEILVAVPTGDGPDQYQNLHVVFEALINVKPGASSDPLYVSLHKTSADLLTTQTEVGGILYRSATRMSAEIVKEVGSHGVILPKDLPALRTVLAEKAQQSFDTVFSKWKYADTYEVEIVITSMYLTDGSVPVNVNPRPIWW